MLRHCHEECLDCTVNPLFFRRHPTAPFDSYQAHWAEAILPAIDIAGAAFVIAHAAETRLVFLISLSLRLSVENSSEQKAASPPWCPLCEWAPLSPLRPWRRICSIPLPAHDAINSDASLMKEALLFFLSPPGLVCDSESYYELRNGGPSWICQHLVPPFVVDDRCMSH